MKTPFEQSRQTMKAILKNDEITDPDTVIARFMFEKFGTLPETVYELDDIQKGIMFAFLEDMVEVQEKREKEAERLKRRNAVRRR